MPGRGRDHEEIISFDAFHVACAESGKADIFLTTDDSLIKQAKRCERLLLVKIANPLDWIKDVLC
jgi:hypothetical protein